MPGVIGLRDLQLSEDTTDDILYLVRTGELAELRSLLADVSTQHNLFSGAQVLHASRDQLTGNGPAHLAAANGHIDVLKYVQGLDAEMGWGISEETKHLSQSLEDAGRFLSKSLMTCQNHSGNTPLHYASINGALEAVKVLVNEFPLDSQALKEDFVRTKNNAGKTAVFEAETGGKEDVVEFLLGALDEPRSTPTSGQPPEQSFVSEERDVSAEDVADEAEGLKLEDK